MSINLLNNKVDCVNYKEGDQDQGENFEEGPVIYEKVEEDPAVDYFEGEIKETVYKKSARWILMIGTVLLPLFFLPWTSSVLELNKQLLLVLVAGTGLVFWLLDVVMSGRLAIRANPIDKGVIALAGAVILSSVFSAAKFKSLMGLAGSLSDSLVAIVALTLLCLLIINSFDDGGKKLRMLFSVSLFIVLLYGLLQIFGLHIFKYLDISLLQFTASRTFNTIGSVNALGIIAAISLPLFYSLNLVVFRRLNIGKIGVLLALAILAVINWWVLWVAAIVGMVSIVALESFAPSDDEYGFKISRFLLPMTVIILGVFLIVINFNLVFVKNNLSIEIAPSHGLSLKTAKESLRENLAFGYGPENFSLAFDKYGAQELSNSTLSGIKFFDSTSQFWNIAVQNGLAGLAALGFVIWLIGWSLFKAARLRFAGLDSEGVGIISSVLATIAAMFFYPFNITIVFSFYVLLALFVLVLWGQQKTLFNVEKRVSLSLVSSLGFIGGLILALVGLYFASLNYAADLKYAQALKQTKAEEALKGVIEAINWNGNDDRFYRLSSQLELVLLSQELNTQSAKEDNQKNNRIQNYLSSAVVLAQRATQVSPREANNWVNLGNTYQNLLRLVDGSDALAEAAYIKASELRPGDPSFHNRIGSMYLLKADILRQLAASGNSVPQLNQEINKALLKAENAFKKAIEISENFGLAIYNLGSVYEREGKLNEAIKQLETIAPFNVDQPGLAFELGLLYYRSNQKDKALAQLQRAVVLSSDYANARWYLALLYEERKQNDQAIEQLEKILSIDANKDNQIVIQKLEELKSGKVTIPPAKVLDQKPL